MSRTIGANLASHIAGTAHKRARMLRLDLQDGSTLAITDHDRPLAYDLGDGSATYSPATGILPSDLSTSTGFDADELEVTGPINSTVTREAIIGGRYDDAEARFFQVNWNSLSDGAIKLLKGYVVLAEVIGSRFKLTIRSEASKFSQQIGLVLSPYCRHDFGDAMCGYVVPTVAATVTAVTSDRQFTVSFSGSYADDFFNRGNVQFLTGALAGTRKVEIADWTSAGVIKLFMPLAAEPTIGDTLNLRIGCLKVARSDDAGARTCMFYDNMVNFGGSPDVPGSDSILPYQVPGA